jgi:hypothetical protein
VVAGAAAEAAASCADPLEVETAMLAQVKNAATLLKQFNFIDAPFRTTLQFDPGCINCQCRQVSRNRQISNSI